MGDINIHTKFSVRKLAGMKPLGRPSVYRGIILKCFLKK
jgi:hypothetical protein